MIILQYNYITTVILKGKVKLKATGKYKPGSALGAAMRMVEGTAI